MQTTLPFWVATVLGKVLRRREWPAWHWEAVHMLALPMETGELRWAQRMLIEKSVCCSGCPLPPRTVLRWLGESFTASASFHSSLYMVLSLCFLHYLKNIYLLWCILLPLKLEFSKSRGPWHLPFCSFKTTSIMPGLRAGGQDMVIECKNGWMSGWMNEHMRFC